MIRVKNFATDNGTAYSGRVRSTIGRIARGHAELDTEYRALYDMLNDDNAIALEQLMQQQRRLARQWADVLNGARDTIPSFDE
jgi:hypothetical protein